MFWNRKHDSAATLSPAGAAPDDGRLRALIDQATGDSQDESDEHAGLLSMIRDELACPFPARLDGEEVECIRLEWPRNGYGLKAVCRSRWKTETVDIGRLEWTESSPRGHQWIEAYLAWRALVQ